MMHRLQPIFQVINATNEKTKVFFNQQAESEFNLLKCFNVKVAITELVSRKISDIS